MTLPEGVTMPNYIYNNATPPGFIIVYYSISTIISTLRFCNFNAFALF